MIGQLLPAGPPRFLFRVWALCVIACCLTAVFVASPLELLAGDSSIWVCNVDGSSPRKVARVAGYGWHGSPQWSPDGSQLAFDAWPSAGGHSQMFKVPVDKDEPVAIGAGMMPHWSPDGKQLAFWLSAPDDAPEKGGVYVCNVDGSGRQWLCKGICPRYSPDGGSLAFADIVDGRTQIYVLDLVVLERRTVVKEGFEDLHGAVSWSPDGKQLAMIGKRSNHWELCTVEVAKPEAGVKTLLKGELGWHPAWSSDGKWFALWLKENAQAGERLHLYSADKADQAPIRLQGQGDWFHNTDPSFSPDCKQLAFVSDRPS